MKLPEMEKPIISNSSHFTVLVEDLLGEYELPRMAHVTVREPWHGYNVDEILGFEHGELKREDLQTLMARMVNAFIEKEVKGGSHLAIADADPYSNYYGITFWAGPNKNFKEVVNNYMEEFRQKLKGYWLNRGADDDYYDYLPSITDVYFALCDFFEIPEQWTLFLGWLINQEGDEVLEESLYRH